MFDFNELLEKMHVEQIDRYLFRGVPLKLGLPHVFGGQVLGQALNAAVRSVTVDRPPHSLHAYFLRPGDLTKQIIYEVDPIRDGGSFSTRRVVAKQNGEAIFNCSTSFHKKEEGLEHQTSLPDGVPMPGKLPNDFDLVGQFEAALPGGSAAEFRSKFLIFGKDIIDLRTPDPMRMLGTGDDEAKLGFWFKFNTVGDDPIVHRTLLAFISDRALMLTGLLPHGKKVWASSNIMMASLDHAMWFHDDFRVDEWMYYHLESPWAGNARDLNHGKFFTQDGRLVASTSQEGLIRVGK